MDDLVPAAPWLLTAAAVIAAAASLAAGRAVPWQGRQVVLVMAAAMLVTAITDGAPTVGLVLGAVLLLSAMLGTVGVRGTRDAAGCFRRALVALLLAVCSFESVATGTAPDPGAHGGHGGLSGLMAVLVVAGVIGVVLWNVIESWIVEPVHHGRVARFVMIESWALAAGAVVMCLGT
ncbi:hypothetical protein J7E45_04160 [Microbacterium sp. ISL-59]|uniref:hypothetical protein n=1 Tax=Microbacterium sp. ISL-59 TaxID=2819159 RepID=UPI001BE54E6A|nr:hypothetical protein [Microbacterium sp. ISL-59]MBT2494792.1 hypothetical protein [Microbacterium sp. ISL-59]